MPNARKPLEKRNSGGGTVRVPGHLFLTLLLTAGSAQAEDWAGWYAGIGLERSEYGFGMPNGSKSYLLNFTFVLDTSEDGGDGSGGALIAGRLWQRDALVYGLELNLGGSNAGLDVDEVLYDLCPTGPCAAVGVASDLQTKAHLRSILGLANSDRMMVFGSLGIAWAEFTPTESYIAFQGSNGGGASLVSGGALGSKTVYGPSIGVGAQFRMGKNLVLRGEVMRDFFEVEYSGYGEASGVFLAGPDTATGTVETGNALDGSIFDVDNTTARMSVIFQF